LVQIQPPLPLKNSAPELGRRSLPRIPPGPVLFSARRASETPLVPRAGVFQDLGEVLDVPADILSLEPWNLFLGLELWSSCSWLWSSTKRWFAQTASPKPSSIAFRTFAILASTAAMSFWMVLTDLGRLIGPAPCSPSWRFDPGRASTPAAGGSSDSKAS